jgi:hypothetical protein
MKRRLLFCLAVISGLVLAFDRPTTTDSSADLKEVLLGYFNGIKTFDTVKMKNLCTADVTIYEEGKEYNNDSVFRDMRGIFPYKADFRFEHFQIFVDKNSGFMSYYENAKFAFWDTVRLDLSFLGSAAFRKEQGVWKMCLLHSTLRYER